MHESTRKCLHNKIKNALVETFQFEGYEAAFEICKTSPRFGTLEALAGSVGDFDSENWQVLVRFAAKLAYNPSTRAMIK